MTQSDSAATRSDARWEAVARRRSEPAHPFVYGVRTTGVYCRAECASRLPKRRNVEFFDTAEQAESAGYRACRRCRPDLAAASDSAAQRLTRACRFIDQAAHPPRLEELASHVGLSAAHVHRLFRTRLGLTPREYAATRRARRLKRELKSGTSVSSAIFASGYGSSGRCYAEAPAVLGMTPRQYRNRGRDARIRFAVAECWLGRVLVAVTDKGVCHIALGDDDAELSRSLRAVFPDAARVTPDAAFSGLLASVVALVERPSASCDFPVDIQGTAFQARVWRALRTIPPGTTRSYSEVARLIGRPGSARAVASACAANRLAVAVPCHRVVCGDGSLSEYRWGSQRKRALLDREAHSARVRGDR